MKYSIEKNDAGSYPVWEVWDGSGFLWAICFTPTEAEETVIRLEIADKAESEEFKIENA